MFNLSCPRCFKKIYSAGRPCCANYGWTPMGDDLHPLDSEPQRVAPEIDNPSPNASAQKEEFELVAFIQEAATQVTSYQVSPDDEKNNQGIQELGSLSKESPSSSSKDFTSDNSIPDSGIYEEKGACFMDANLAFPGTSDYQDNWHASNKLWENFQSLQSNYEKQLCPACKKDMDEHIVVYEGKTLYQCCLCRHRSTRKYNLRMHISSYGNDHFFCNTCEKVVKEKGVHTREQTCNICYAKFSCKALFELHSRDHEGIAPLFCRKCRERRIHEHIVEHEGGKYFQCCQCSFTSEAHDTLSVHLNSHTDPKIFVCEVCRRGYTSKRNLQKHTGQHPKELPFECDICSARFSSEQSLERHNLDHERAMNLR